MSPLLLLVIAAVVAFAIYKSSAFKRWRYSKDLTFPEVPKRADLLFGYYGCADEQANETLDHVNLFWEHQVDGVDKASQNILLMSRTTVLDLSAQMFTRTGDKGPFTLRDDALVHVMALFQHLSATGALKYVKFLCPIDEPNNTVANETVLLAAIKVVFDAASQFIELRGVRLACIYAADKPFICQELFALVGFDDYDMKSHVLVSHKYLTLVESLRPGQQIMLVPGGCYGQDPAPFVNFAQANAEVGAIVCFLWYDNKTGTVGAPGIRSGPLRAAYREAGRSVCAIS